jgi:hypothetical protein
MAMRERSSDGREREREREEEMRGEERGQFFIIKQLSGELTVIFYALKSTVYFTLRGIENFKKAGMVFIIFLNFFLKFKKQNSYKKTVANVLMSVGVIIFMYLIKRVKFLNSNLLISC